MIKNNYLIMERITYIYLYSNVEVRYIINRSIAFENVIGKKMMDALMCLGLNTYAKLLYNLEEELQQFNTDITNPVGNITILETHVEWPNENREDQKEINKRKKELAEQLNAVVYKTDIEVEDADAQVKIVVMSAVKKLMQNMVNTLAPFVKSDLTFEINELDKQKKKLKFELDQINLSINYKNKEIIKLDDKKRELEKHIRHCNRVLENELEPKVYEFYCEELRNAIETKEKEYDMYSNKVEDLKLEINKLNLKLASLVQKEGKLYANL